MGIKLVPRCIGCRKPLNIKDDVVLTEIYSVVHKDCFIYPIVREGYLDKGTTKEILRNYDVLADLRPYFSLRR